MLETIENIIPDSHRVTMLWAADKIVADPTLVPLLIDTILADTPPLSMRAARVLNFVVEKKQRLFVRYENKLVENIAQFQTEGVLRGLFWIFAKYPHLVSEHNHGTLIHFAFNALFSKHAPAIKVYCIDFLLQMLHIYPQLKPELNAQLELMHEYDEPSIKAAISRALKTIRRLA